MFKTAAKTVIVVLVLVMAILGVSYGAFRIVLGPTQWWRLGGIAMIGVAMRGFIFIFDILWGRPPQFSKRPWERPWEDDAL